jgi:hypothetical protein
MNRAGLEVLVIRKGVWAGSRSGRHSAVRSALERVAKKWET